MIRRGVLKLLIELITSENLIVQTKAFEDIMHFDGKFSNRNTNTLSIEILLGLIPYRIPILLYCIVAIHQPEMIKQGILKHLAQLIVNNNIQIQTKALAVIQYFDGN